VFPKNVTPEALRMLKDEGAYSPAEILAAGMDEEIMAMWFDLGPTMFGQEVECSFTEYAGRVYFDFDEEVHVRDLQYNPGRPLYVATDYGFTNPNVALFIQTDVWDNVYVIAEYYRSGRTDDEFADDVFESPRLGPLARAATLLYPDPEDPSATKVLSNRWRVRAQGGTGGLIKDRINLIRRYLKIQNPHLPFGHELRVPRIFWDRSCKESHREMDAYRYPQNRSEIKEAQENPLKKDDHCPEALSRFFAGYYGTNSLTGGPRVRKARVG